MRYYKVFAVVHNHYIFLGYVLAASEIEAVVSFHITLISKFSVYKVELS